MLTHEELCEGKAPRAGSLQTAPMGQGKGTKGRETLTHPFSPGLSRIAAVITPGTRGASGGRPRPRSG